MAQRDSADVGLPVQIFDDASYYSTTDAERLFVSPRYDLPRSFGHTVVVGPRGAGKTHLLKALHAQWRRDTTLLPFYLELLAEEWIPTIGGEVELEADGPLSPRDKAMVECMRLALSLAIAKRASAHLTDSVFLAAVSDVGPRATSGADWLNKTSDSIATLMRRGRGAQPPHHDVSAVAHRLGTAVQDATNKRVLLLVDQIDRIGGAALQPVLSLLQRASGYSFVLASRPCPAAPAVTMTPRGANADDAYKIFPVGMEGDTKKQADVVAHMYALLAREGRLASEHGMRTVEELRPYAQIIASLTWPTLRYAVSLFLSYDSHRSSGKAQTEALVAALRHVQRECKTNAEDQIGAWCANPSALIESWRERVAKGSRSDAIRGRMNLVRPQVNDDMPKPAQRFLRVALKCGVFYSSDSATYLGERMPDSYDIPPLLTAPPDVVPTPQALVEPSEWEFSSQDILGWVNRGAGGRTAARSRVFVSLYTGGVTGARLAAASALFRALEEGLGDDVELRSQDDVGGSTALSVELRNIVRNVGLVVCDLSVLRREVFLEYGWAVGSFRPVVQVAEARAGLDQPEWLKAMPIFFYANDDEKKAMCRSVVMLLNNPSEPTRAWKVAPDGTPIDDKAQPETILFLGSKKDLDRARNEYHNIGANLGLALEYFEPDPDDAQLLFRMAAKVRAAGTLILAPRDERDLDFLCCLAGGMFTAVTHFRIDKHQFDRQVIVLDESPYAAGSQLLRMLPEVRTAKAWSKLRRFLADRQLRIEGWRKLSRRAQ